VAEPWRAIDCGVSLGSARWLSFNAMQRIRRRLGGGNRGSHPANEPEGVPAVESARCDSGDDSVARSALLELMPRGARCAEVGVWRGDFSERILRDTAPRELHLVDPWLFMPSYPESWYGGLSATSQADMDEIFAALSTRFDREVSEGVVIIHRLRSVDAAREFPDGFFDWLYLDADHTFEAASADLARFWPKVRPDGYLTGDDYLDGGWWEGGVKRAVDEFIKRADCTVVSLERSQFVLRRGSTF
jgi:Methyltransferase domain